jgi:uncharacterized protein YjiS (DUF1127 family)
MSFEPRHENLASALSVDAPISIASPRPRLFRRVALAVALWHERTAQRRSLAQMDARSLRDAGISPAAAAYESGKSFWQPMGGLR